MLIWERIAPSYVGKGGFAPIMRLSGGLGVIAGFLYFCERSTCGSPPQRWPCVIRGVVLTLQTVRFYGFKENKRETDMDMREMVDKVKKGVPLYGESKLAPHMQGVASRNSRYSGVWLHVIPWFNFVNHDQVGSSGL